MISSSILISALILLQCGFHHIQAWTQPPSSSRTSRSPGASVNQVLYYRIAVPRISSTKTSLSSFSSTMAMTNVFKKFPWNVKKEQERQARRLRIERAQLHRELGIAEDATYEEIVAATNQLLAIAGNDLKKKVKIEIAKDKILQIRLNERLAGLAQANREARAQSNYEIDGDDDDDDNVSTATKAWNTPKWIQGLVVKPDEKHLKSQIRLWGIITALGAALPPVQDYLGRFTWLVCVAQLTFRGMPREEVEGGGMGIAFESGGQRGGHRKVAFAIGFSLWIVGSIFVYGLMPSWARAQRWTGTVGFAMQNLIFAVASCYLQPYKGGSKRPTD